MTSEEIKRRIAIDPDFVFFPRFDNSLKKLKDRYPAEAPDKIIAMALQLEDDQVEAMWDKIIRACKRRI